jgi:hypothetical protein
MGLPQALSDRRRRFLDRGGAVHLAENPGVGAPVETRYATPRLRSAASRLLAHEVGAHPATAEHLAAAAGRVLDNFSQRLAEVIGPAGVDAIVVRAVKLRRPEFAFLDNRIIARETGVMLAEPLRACLREQEPDVIREVSVSLFATIAGLLATVIGDRLAWNLVQQIWPDTLPRDGELQEAQG